MTVAGIQKSKIVGNIMVAGGNFVIFGTSPVKTGILNLMQTRIGRKMRI